MKICVFCSANNDIDHNFIAKAEELGTWAARNGHDIVFGGHDAGLMHAVSRACKDAGGKVIGVVPKRIEEMGRLTPFLDVHVPCKNLTDRKQLMSDMSDAFVVLPGGIGTLDELFTVLGERTLNYHGKPVILYDINGFFQPLIALLRHLEANGMLRRPLPDLFSVCTDISEVDLFLNRASLPA